ncbi:8-oxo-dGTP diphosphatase [Methylomagnum ishizawai]|uniref:8-oxo-dGTP diphosphatase n=1 Tax=Methylomagnum ishizawai TaxID=1760988 RepID=A0A1Y6D0G9_9GAMM|nr:Nudix family hydrolase [Methylomagnum ishizawai]SMF96428.1 8-oxo-dGTP diphosphatase [Methylomagnum ishizawai]
MPNQRPAPAMTPTAPILEVAAGVIHDREGRILIAKRPAHLHQGDLWEFPGGKLEPGETAAEALRRELREELDIDAEAAMPLIDLRHDYPDRRVRLSVWRVERFTGTPKGLQGQPIRWVRPDELPHFDFPAANRPIITAARLPDHYAILDGDGLAGLKTRLDRLVATGISMIQLRAKGLEARDFAALVDYTVPLCRRSGIRLLLNAAPELARNSGADGVHLTAARLLALDARPLDAPFWVAASCHNAAELRHAERVGVDFAVLSPVRPTASHPGAEPLGWDVFADWVDRVALPVYALGGLLPADVGEAKRRGAQGIAGIRGFLEGFAPQ